MSESVLRVERPQQSGKALLGPACSAIHHALPRPLAARQLLCLSAILYVRCRRVSLAAICCFLIAKGFRLQGIPAAAAPIPPASLALQVHGRQRADLRRGHPQRAACGASGEAGGPTIRRVACLGQRLLAPTAVQHDLLGLGCQ
jgi:hypothetical protein